MDGLSAAATVLQLLQVAAQVSTAVGQYVAAVKCAESSRSKLLDQITLMTTAAKAVGSVLQNPPSSRTPEQQALLMEWFRREGSAARCKKTLEDLLGWLHSEVDSKKHTRWVKRLMWPVEENKIHAAIRAFEGHMSYFRDILSIDTSIRIQEFTSIITSEREYTRNKDIAAARREFIRAGHEAAVHMLKNGFYPGKLLEWLDGVDCTVKHESTREQRQRETGEWLFNEELYIQWRESSFGLLWLSGKGGFCRSGVIDSLSSGLADDETLAYFYCDFRTPRSTHTMEVLRSLTTQLLWNSKIDWLSSFPELVIAQRARYRRAAKLHQRPVIVIDALDECEDLSKLLDELGKLDKACRLFVTSRPLHSINRVFVGRPSISLNNRVDEVQNDMLKILAHDLQVEIRDVLMEKADGVFRWVQCQLDRLNGCWSLGDLREVLDTLTHNVYTRHTERHAARNRQERVWWPSCSNELSSQKHWQSNRDNPASKSTIATMHETDLIEICGSLCQVIGEHRNHVSDHRRSYARNWRYHVWVSVIPQLALYTIIRFGHASMLRHYLDHHSVQVTRGANPLVYAALYRDAPSVQELLDQGLDVNIEAIVPINRRRDMPSLPPLIAATRNRDFQEELVTLLLARGSTVPRNAIHSVLRRNADGVCKPFTIQILLQHGADAMLSEAGGQSCLHSLLRHGYRHTEYNNDVFEIAPLRLGAFQLVEWLVKNGFPLPPDAVLHAVRCPDSDTLLPMLRLLFESGTVVDVWDDDGCNALHVLFNSCALTLQENTEMAVKLLLQNGCDIDYQNHEGETPLHMAAQSGTLGAVEFLVDQGARLPRDIINHCVTGNRMRLYDSGMSLLDRLVTSAWCKLPEHMELHGEPVEQLSFLLENGCDFRATGSSGVTVLGLQSVKLLQEAGYDLVKYANTLNSQGYTPLCIVLPCRKYRPAIISYLLHSGAKFSDVNPLFLDNLQWASDLPWYSDATKAYQQTLAKPKITVDDVDRVYHLLVDHCGLPVSAVRRIMDAAEYWAFTKALRKNLNIRSILIYDTESIASPAVPSSENRDWVPRRVMFSCKLRAIDHLGNIPLEPPTTVFGVWDQYTPAEQLNGRQRLAVKDLTCGDMLRLVFAPWVETTDAIELEFFQIDMYFTMRATDDSPSFK
ncbi:hypothetical protein BU15DRAFT_67789 [Melanogaster broomeanus]|nr:hypothetical protein BU15DRAFT_67789 [Melanogaster broomeanus]